MENKITGKVLHISGIETVGQNATEKQTIVIEETDGKYPDSVAIDAFKDRIQQLSSIKVGDEVTANFNLKANLHKGKWYQNASLYKLEKLDDGNESNQHAAPSMPPEHQEDDLPF